MDLPPELLVKIINRLPVEDINRCKLVNKKYNTIVNSFIKLRNLTICDYLPIKEKHFITSEPVDCLHSIKINDRSLDLIISKLDQSMFLSLRRLYITNIYKEFLEIDFLNAFQKLNCLEITNLKIKTKKRSCTLNLPNLSILNIDNISPKGLIVFDTIALEKLRLNLDDANMKKIKFNHNGSIRLLEMNKYNSCVKLFQNLEFLYSMHRIENVDLARWPNLKELQFFEDEECWKLIMKQKEELARDELIVYYYGVKLNDLPNNKIQTYLFNHYIKPETIALYGPNFCNLASVLPFITLITYSELEDCLDQFTVNISSFLQRFVNLNCLIVTKRINNFNEFLNVLACCPNLNQLQLRSASLNQEFFNNQLPHLCKNLTSLGILKENELDFNFLIKFNKLVEFSIDQKISLDFVCNLIKCKNFEDFSFQFTSNEITISCFETIKEYKLIVNGEKFFSNSKDEMLETLKIKCA